MQRSMRTPPPGEAPRHERAGRAPFGLMLVIGAGVGCALPWMQATGASLTANAYDLAEWLSLHPTVRATSRVLLPALVLRFTLATVALLALARARQARHKALPVALALGLWAGLLPPAAFFQGNLRDVNYLQQALLWAGVTLAAVVLWRLPHRYHVIAQTALGVVGVGGALWGVSVALDLMGRYEIPVQTGPGVMLFTGAILGYIGVIWWEKPAGRKTTPPAGQPGAN